MIIRLHNYKSHADTEIKLTDVDSFVGTSDHGKTNILKAMKMVCQHQDFPVDYIKEGTTTSWVEIETESGNSVRRIRKPDSQSTIIKESGKIIELDGMKGAEPYVRRVLGFNKVTLDENTGPEDLNFINASDKSLNCNPETTLRKISGILGTNKIEDARSRLGKEAKKRKEIQTKLQTELNKLTNNLSSRTELFQVINESFQQLQDLYTNWDQKKQHLEKLSEFSDYIHSIGITLDKTELIELRETNSNKLKELNELAQLLSVMKTAIKLAEKVNVLKSNCNCTQIWIQDCKKLLIKYQSLVDIDNLDYDIRSLMNQLISHKTNIDQTNTLVSEITMKRHELISELAVCPVCGQVLGDN